MNLHIVFNAIFVFITINFFQCGTLSFINARYYLGRSSYECGQDKQQTEIEIEREKEKEIPIRRMSAEQLLASDV